MTRRQMLAALVGLAGTLGARPAAAQSEPRYYVTGFVKTPGSFTFEENLSVLQCIASAGGVTEHGSLRRVVIRRKVDGQDVEVPAKLTDVVLPFDVIFVPRRL